MPEEKEITSTEAGTDASAHRNRSGLLGWRILKGGGRFEVKLQNLTSILGLNVIGFFIY